MLRAAILAILVPMLALCWGPEAEASSSASLAVFLRFDEPYSEKLLSAMKAETEDLLRPAGIRIAWQTEADHPPGAAYPELLVVRLRGHCQAAVPAVFNELGPYWDTVGLGSSNITDGEVRSYGEVQCDRVRHVVDPEARGKDRERQEVMLGRGLGRVLAHELRHMLLKETGHAHDGVGKSSQSTRDLTAGEFRFDNKDVAELRARWQALLRGEPGAPTQ